MKAQKTHIYCSLGETEHSDEVQNSYKKQDIKEVLFSW